MNKTEIQTSNIIDESKYLRVSTILSKYNNYENVPKTILDYAADRGTRVHKYCELYACNMLFETVDEDCFEYVQAFIDWFDENVEEVVHTETRLYCDTFSFQGQFDLIAKLKNRPGNTLIDTKTCLKTSRVWPIQLSAYQYLCSNNGICISDRMVLQLTKDRKYNEYVFHAETYKKDRETFFSILAIHDYFYGEQDNNE